MTYRDELFPEQEALLAPSRVAPQVIYLLVLFRNQNSGVATPSAARAHHKSAAISSSEICFQEFKMKEDHASSLFEDTV